MFLIHVYSVWDGGSERRTNDEVHPPASGLTGAGADGGGGADEVQSPVKQPAGGSASQSQPLGSGPAVAATEAPAAAANDATPVADCAAAAAADAPSGVAPEQPPPPSHPVAAAAAQQQASQHTSTGAAAASSDDAGQATQPALDEPAGTPAGAAAGQADAAVAGFDSDVTRDTEGDDAPGPTFAFDALDSSF